MKTYKVDFADGSTTEVEAASRQEATGKAIDRKITQGPSYDTFVTFVQELAE